LDSDVFSFLSLSFNHPVSTMSAMNDEAIRNVSQPNSPMPLHKDDADSFLLTLSFWDLDLHRTPSQVHFQSTTSQHGQGTDSSEAKGSQDG
jgi:hypothetical protein